MLAINTARPPFHADHVGSLVRPLALYQKRQLLAEGKIRPEELREAENEGIKYIVKLQQEAGMKTITDGELRRGMFYEGVFDKLDGMTLVKNRSITTFKPYIPHIKLMYNAGMQEAESIFCTGKIRRTKPWYVDDFKYLKNILPPESLGSIKITMCSPSWFHQRHGSDFTYDLSVYKCDNDYFDDLGVAYRAEFQDLYDLGCRHIQIDDPTFCYFCDEDMIIGMENDSVDHEALLDTYIRAINVCTQGRPDDLIISIHMCRGNFKGGIYFSEGSYARIAVKLFNTLDVNAFYLEYDTERAGDFSPLKHLPLNKTVVLGLVTTKNPKLEDIEELKGRINEAVEVLTRGNPNRSKEVALNQLCISTQCGFASVWQGNPLTEEDEKRKFALLVETAKQVWSE